MSVWRRAVLSTLVPAAAVSRSGADAHLAATTQQGKTVHDDVVMLLDGHLRHLEAVRRKLCASRQVDWGERSDALADSVAASRHFAATAADLLAQIGGVPPQYPGAPSPPHDDQWDGSNKSRPVAGLVT
jgi:hypothetical protein